jgi:hypothetical protein
MKTMQTLLFLLFSFSLMAQNSPFKAGATVGLNLAQVDGDKEFGYQKKGLTLGLRGGIVINQRLEILTELLYNFKGAQPTLQEKATLEPLVTLDLHYADIPILAKFSFGQSEDDYYKWNVYGGLSYGRLLRSNINILKRNGNMDTVNTTIVNQVGFKTSEISLIVGISRYFSPRFGMSLRHTSALTPFYKDTNLYKNAAGFNTTPLYQKYKNFFISINLFYDFVAPKIVFKKKKEAPQ